MTLDHPKVQKVKWLDMNLSIVNNQCNKLLSPYYISFGLEHGISANSLQNIINSGPNILVLVQEIHYSICVSIWNNFQHIVALAKDFMSNDFYKRP